MIRALFLIGVVLLSATLGSAQCQSRVGALSTSDNTLGVDIQGEYAYVTIAAHGLAIIDISNPAVPVEVGYFDSGESASQGVSADGRFVYIADRPYGFRVVDVLDPANPVDVGVVDTDDLAMGVALSDDGLVAVVTDRQEGVKIFDLGACVLIFGDGFEDHTTSQWSDTLPSS